MLYICRRKVGIYLRRREAGLGACLDEDTERMSQLLPQTGSQQLNADVNIFTNLLVKDSGKYPLVASIYQKHTTLASRAAGGGRVDVERGRFAWEL